MSRVYDTEGGEYEDIDNVSEYKSDMEVGAAISACYIASVEEVYVSRCKEDDMAITWDEIFRNGAKDSSKRRSWKAFRRRLRSAFLSSSHSTRTGSTSQWWLRTSWRWWSTTTATSGLGC